ncbi:MAG: Uma2 family endonuclease [Nocardioides sp.]|uniref:Uma2 family endonuclease n=1 Tax=Nocardioides sp. TaxID=35761 RepID=UPI0039E608E6
MDVMTMVRSSGLITREERDALPDDGRRHELIDGMLIVTPSPGFPHQTVVGRLHLALQPVCPPELRVILGPFDVALAEDTVVVPDLVVASLSSFTPRDLPTSPLLAIEVLSPSTRRYDQTLKKARYAAAGCQAYLLVDPIEPSITAFELRDGDYVEVASSAGDDPCELVWPFPVTLVPAELVRP